MESLFCYNYSEIDTKNRFFSINCAPKNQAIRGVFAPYVCLFYRLMAVCKIRKVKGLPVV